MTVHHHRLLLRSAQIIIKMHPKYLPGSLLGILQACKFHVSRFSSSAGHIGQHSGLKSGGVTLSNSSRTKQACPLLSKAVCRRPSIFVSSYDTHFFPASYHRASLYTASASNERTPLSSRLFTTSSAAVQAAKKVERPSTKTKSNKLDEKCQVFDSDELLVGHMTVRAAEELASKESMKLLDLGLNADNLRSFRLVTGKELMEENKRQRLEKKAEQAKVKEKELRIMSKITDHDLETKVKQARDILTKGGQIKLTIRANKRSQVDPDKQMSQLMKKITTQLSDCALIKHGTKNEHELQLLLRPVVGQNTDSAT